MALVTAGWALLSWLGIDSLRPVRARHVPGFPDTGQIIIYGIVPVLMLTGLAMAAFYARRVAWVSDLYPMIVFLGFFGFLPALAIGAGF